MAENQKEKKEEEEKLKESPVSKLGCEEVPWTSKTAQMRQRKQIKKALHRADKEAICAEENADENEDEQAGPVIVHCSAGLGRTGCFIALCIGSEQLRREGVVDILGIVSKMRLDRGGMVQVRTFLSYCTTLNYKEMDSLVVE
ncbi:unnamed protein product [Protopolystoma xenopodis]|uniref:protein-tyrosine-phosphatase n=1 Tax=Protopolystoma xenopodis TaxID=117903 RepID=A0A3S4ZYB8_9PLAT|nr:unnamed protein product [Protopolystoma xenopodis]